MTPKEKAEELVEKFSLVGLQQRNEGIACALIAVDEIIKVSRFYNDSQVEIIYWCEVKQEIEKL
jgi:hypothetical protein